MNNAPNTGPVLCVGFACVDAVYQVEHQPAADEKVFARGLTIEGGGPATNAAVAVARLGMPSALATYLGTDVLGDLHFRELVREGVDTTLIVRGRAPTPLATALVKPDGARSVVSYRPTLQSCEPFALPVATPSLILSDGHYHELAAPLLKAARENSVPLLLDAGSVHAGTLELLKLADWVVASERFAMQYTKATSPAQAVEDLAKEMSRPVAVTCGAAGVWWRDGAASGRVPAYAVEVKSTLAAGDCFHGAFAVGLVRGLAFEESLRFANGAAALKCTQPGGRLGFPNLESLLQFLTARDSPLAEKIAGRFRSGAEAVRGMG